MVKDGEDQHRLKITKLKSLAKLFKPFNRDWAPLKPASSLHVKIRVPELCMFEDSL